MKVYALRHGQSQYNLLGLCNDDPKTDVHLNDTGKLQAQAAAERPIARAATSGATECGWST